jgi:hypothetical protein
MAQGQTDAEKLARKQAEFVAEQARNHAILQKIHDEAKKKKR